MPRCRDCNIMLTKANRYPSVKRSGEKVCIECYKKLDKERYLKRKKEFAERGKQYRQTEEGKTVNRRKLAKRNRKLGFTPLMSNPFPKDVPVDYHHINNTFVVPIPRQVHMSMLGKNHRIKVNDWIEEHIGLVGV